METINAVQSIFGVAPGQPWLLITNLGSDLAYIATLVLYFWLGSPREARTLGLFFALSAFLNTVLKDSVREPRPFVQNPAIASEAAQKTAGGFAFPSGHAMVTATLWVLMALQKRSSVLWAVAIVLTLIVGFSRVILGVHYLSDVLVGFLLGVLLALLGAYLSPALERLNRESFSSVSRWLPAALLGVGSVFVDEEWGRSLGLGAGFWLAKADFEPPQSWPLRLLYAGLGLAVAVALYLASSAVLPTKFKRSGIGAFIRYTVLVLLIVEGVPRAFRLRAVALPSNV